eukprot:59367-Prorocentrum_minimum.AAC.1
MGDAFASPPRATHLRHPRETSAPLIGFTGRGALGVLRGRSNGEMSDSRGVTREVKRRDVGL